MLLISIASRTVMSVGNKISLQYQWEGPVGRSNNGSCGSVMESSDVVSSSSSSVDSSSRANDRSLQHMSSVGQLPRRYQEADGLLHEALQRLLSIWSNSRESTASTRAHERYGIAGVVDQCSVENYLICCSVR